MWCILFVAMPLLRARQTAYVRNSDYVGTPRGKYADRPIGRWGALPYANGVDGKVNPPAGKRGDVHVMRPGDWNKRRLETKWSCVVRIRVLRTEWDQQVRGRRSWDRSIQGRSKPS